MPNSCMTVGREHEDGQGKKGTREIAKEAEGQRDRIRERKGHRETKRKRKRERARKRDGGRVTDSVRG